MDEKRSNFDLAVTLPVEKAVSEDGDLHIEGIAADYEPDRQGEAFLPGAFDNAIQKYLDAGGPLCYHHKPSMQLGQVTEMRPTDGGLAMKAVIPKPDDPALLDIYKKIKRGMMRGLSLSGRALQRMTPAGPRIGEIDIQETSITPVPVGPGAMFKVAQKAFPDDYPDPATNEQLKLYFETQFDDTFNRLNTVIEKASGPTAEQRKKYGMAGGEFPIWHCGAGPGGVIAAKSDIGRTKLDKAAVKAHIRRRAKALGCPDKAKFEDD